MRIKNASTHARNFKAHGLDISIPAGESIRVPPGSEESVHEELYEMQMRGRLGTKDASHFVLEDDEPELVHTPRFTEEELEAARVVAAAEAKKEEPAK